MSAAEADVGQAGELAAFAARHPTMTITSPGENGTLKWRATWLTVSTADAERGAEIVELEDPGRLLAELKARFGRSAS